MFYIKDLEAKILKIYGINIGKIAYINSGLNKMLY